MGEGDADKPLEVLVEVIGRTDVGQVREHNEDCFLMVRLGSGSRDAKEMERHPLDARGTLLVVCDGMGGAAAGEVASSMAVESLAESLVKETASLSPGSPVEELLAELGRKLRDAAREANRKIHREASENLARTGMGTTMTAVHLAGKHAIVAQVGDSRAYFYRKGNFTQVTRDQSLVNQLLESGHITAEQAKYFEHSNVILQALGVTEYVDVQLSRVELCAGDRLLVCSDGLVGVVSDEEIAAVLGSVESLHDAARMLIELANSAGGPDNITVIVAQLSGSGLAPPGDEDAIEYRLWQIEPAEGSAPESDVNAPAPPADSTRELTRPPVPASPTVELISMAVVIALCLASIVTGAALYRSGVACRIESASPQLAVVADGKDTGARTRDPLAAPHALEVRLKPGRHTVALRGVGAPDDALEVEVVRGEACTLRFAR